ncbi:PREDICTED: uncharacterized protein LOC104821593 [Tarenaya hassleriana]|uniref:uncharacterized protein LOC104821593 n=1 Tax=Tarenaya hassleriana TaxID=28532 RepID=UPI00053C400B|nr:PREDICTED: uncharacterized protein LOC104821593 [Tarenaya hassleriana]
MRHLWKKGFVSNYYVWVYHGETFQISDENISVRNTDVYDQPNSYIEMVQDAFPSQYNDQVTEDPMNEASKKFFDLLEAANQPIYDGCKEGLSQLSASARLMGMKTSYNLTENCMNEVCQMLNDYLPQGNNAPDSYYDMSKLMGSLGMESIKIDVCPNNCMIFWKESNQLDNCRFCGAERYKAKKSGQRNRVPYKRMFYLPIKDRLRRLYESHQLASHMRWHAEHTSDPENMSHPSDGDAWKNFNEVYPNFASEHRNVYLCLCTDGFAPYGQSGKQYSLWPIVMSPYNLPPDMCLKKEFLFLTVLIPGPEHPKKSFDIFLQPLIEELLESWHCGIDAYDASQKENFRLKAVLMWTISDFPAYGMLSGWSTHGRLACPYCMDDIQSFQLRHGRKSCWFDYHRRFLSLDHPWRRNKINFRKNKIVTDSPPLLLTGEEILWERIESIHGLDKTIDCGGNGHRKPCEYGETHNWYKRSIIWDLPYWRW